MVARGFYFGAGEGTWPHGPSFLHSPLNPEVERDILIMESKEMAFSFRALIRLVG